MDQVNFPTLKRTSSGTGSISGMLSSILAQVNQKAEDGTSDCEVTNLGDTGYWKIRETGISRFANYGVYLAGHGLNLRVVKVRNLKSKNPKPIKRVVNCPRIFVLKVAEIK